jgi:hypothetical protein
VVNSARRRFFASIFAVAQLAFQASLEFIGCLAEVVASTRDLSPFASAKCCSKSLA